tara:strand:- start:1734 stop:3713 length:1980 start_codon:yes stop_codon:yes gene_type:complete
MYRIITASSDTYITNKIINNRFRATDANVGQAGTLDLFKLYNESTIKGETKPIEISRLLIKFDLDKVKTMNDSGQIDITDSSFKAFLNLHDVYGGETTPNNFKCIVFPLAKDFDEGVGYDIGNFNDLDSTNYITASHKAIAVPTAATAAVAVANGTAASGMSEKQTITLKSATEISKTYVIVDSAKTSVSTGDVLASDSDTGDSTAGSSLSGGIAVSIDLSSSPSTQNDFLGQLRSAIIGTSGHNGAITVGATPTGAGAQSLALTQTNTGYSGNNTLATDISNVTTTGFAGGTGGVESWSLPGANKSGSLGDINIDVIVSGTLDSAVGSESLCFEQSFEKGTEDLNVEVTKFVSASVKDLITNRGFLIAFSGSYENDGRSYFVKRFASRNSANTSIRPKLIIKFDDSIEDNHCNFVFNTSGSLYLSNQVRGASTNLRTGDSPGDIATGENCMILKIVTGSFKKTLDVSQALRGENRVTGLYSSSFAISSFGSLYDDVLASGSITFDEVWSNSTETIAFLSSSLTVTRNQLNQADYNQTSYHVTTINLSDRYKIDEVARIRVFVEERTREVVYRKEPFEKKSQVYNNMHYRVRDFISGDIIIPFNKSDKSNKLSSDSRGMYFDFFMSSLPRGRAYVFDFLITVDGFDNVITDSAAKFIVE